MAAALLDVSLVAVLAVVTVADLRARIVPDRALLVGVAIALPLCVLEDPGEIADRVLAGTGAGGFLLGAALIRPDGMGLGDVKLTAVLGLYLGVAVVGALLVAFLAGSIAGLALLARYGWEARSRTIPFAPFLALGGLAAIVAQH